MVGQHFIQKLGITTLDLKRCSESLSDPYQAELSPPALVPAPAVGACKTCEGLAAKPSEAARVSGQRVKQGNASFSHVKFCYGTHF